jgi:bifunctional non-homologous end joining protein LigD
MQELKQADLFCTNEAHDKEYHIWISKEHGGYSVQFEFGKRGSNLVGGQKNVGPLTLEKAEALFLKVVREKVAKGYMPVDNGQPWIKRFCMVAEV